MPRRALAPDPRGDSAIGRGPDDAIATHGLEPGVGDQAVPGRGGVHPVLGDALRGVPGRDAAASGRAGSDAFFEPAFAFRTIVRT